MRITTTPACPAHARMQPINRLFHYSALCEGCSTPPSAGFPGVVSAFEKYPVPIAIGMATIGNKNRYRQSRTSGTGNLYQEHSIENQSTMRIAREQLRKFMTKTATTERSELVVTFEKTSKSTTFVINVYGNKSCKPMKKPQKTVIKANKFERRPVLVAASSE